MATPNSGSIPQESLDQVTPGIEQPLDSRADELCVRRTDVESTSGTAPFLSPQMTTSRGENRDLAKGETVQPSRSGMGEVEYECLRQAGASEIYDESDIASQRFDLDLIDHYSQQAQQDANTATDRKFADVLRSTTDNLEFDATTDGNGAWDDPANSTPEQDLVDVSELVPHANMAIAGQKIVSALRKSPDLAPDTHMYESEGVITADSVRARVAAVLDIDPSNVYLMTDWTRNISATKDGYELGFIGEDVMWVGTDYDLQLFDPNHSKNRYSWSERVNSDAKEQVGFQRYVDIVRHIQENAVTVTNAIS